MSAALYPPESVSWSPERRAEVLRTREVLFHGTAQERRQERDVVDHDPYEEDEYDGLDEYAPDFADPGGVSALRAAGPNNPRNLPCPTCHAPNRLTPADAALGYQCDACADRAERGGDY